MGPHSFPLRRRLLEARSARPDQRHSARHRGPAAGRSVSTRNGAASRPRRRNHRWWFAVHEAAHAVVAHVQGVALYRTTIALDGGCRGLTITAGPTPEEPDINIGSRGRASWEKHLRTMLAAAIAEQSFAREPIRGIFAKPDETFRDDANDATMFAF